MPAYLLAGPAVALIGIVAIVFVMRHRSVQTRSMYSSRRSQIQRKVQAARTRTLAPHGRSNKAPTDAEIAATSFATSAPAYEAPVAPKQAWEMPATPAYAPPPAAAPPAYEPPAYSPPPAQPEPAAPAFEPAPSVPAPEEPSWTPVPAEPAWTPAPAPAAAAPAPAVAPVERAPAPPEPVSRPAGGGASWEIVGDSTAVPEEEPATKGKDKRRKAEAAGGSPWQLASGDAPGEEGGDEVVKPPSATMAIAQYAVLVVGLVMVLIGVVVMVANSKVT